MSFNSIEQLADQYYQYIKMTDCIFDINEENMHEIFGLFNQCKEKYSISDKQILKIIICASKYRESRLELYFKLITSYFDQELIKNSKEILDEKKNLKDAIFNHYNPDRNVQGGNKHILNQFYKIPVKYFVNDDVDELIKFINDKSGQINTNATLHKKSYLNYCAMLGSVKCFEYLRINNAKIDDSTLENAVVGGNIEIFHMVEQLCNDNDHYQIIHNTLLKAIQCHDDTFAYYLIDKYSLDFSFLRCAECYNMKYFIYKLRNSKTINDRDEFESTALRASIHFEIPSFVSYICNLDGCDLNLGDNQKETPLMTSAILGNEEIAKILIEKGADLNLKSVSGYSALMYCCENNSISIAKLLIERGAIKYLWIDNRNKRIYAKDIAEEKGYQEIVNLLK